MCLRSHDLLTSAGSVAVLVRVLPAVHVYKCRLTQQGVRVLVERPVHRTEFQEYEAFDPNDERKRKGACDLVS